MAYSLDKLLEDTSRHKSYVHKLTLPFLSLVWQHICAYLCTQLRHGKPVSLQSSQLGKFTFLKDPISGTDDTHQSQVTKERRRVVFVLNESFARNYDIKFLKRPYDHSMPVVEANYFIIAQRCAVLKETVILAMKSIVERLGEIIQTGKQVSIEFDNLGVLKSDRKVCEFEFHKQWEEALEVKVAKRVSIKKSSSKKRHSTRSAKPPMDDIEVLEVDEPGSLATLSEVGMLNHEEASKLSHVHQFHSSHNVNLQQKNRDSGNVSPPQFVPTPPTPKRPKSSSGARRFVGANDDNEKRVALQVASATVVMDEEEPARDDKPKRLSKKKRTKRAKSSNRIDARHETAPPRQNDNQSDAPSDVISSVSSPSKHTGRPQSAHGARKYSFPNLREGSHGPQSMIELLRKMSASHASNLHYAPRSAPHHHSPTHSAFRESLLSNNTQDTHVEAITKTIERSPYRARKAPDAALNAAMMEAFQRYESQIRQQFEEQEREEWERLRKIEQNEKNALQAHFERRMKNKEVQDFLKKQILFSQKLRFSDEQTSRNKPTDDFNNRIGVSTGAVMRAEKQKGQLLRQSLEQQLADKKRREQMIQRYDMEQEFKIIEDDQENYKKEREYLARRKKQTQEMLNKSWDHQVMIRSLQEESTNESFRRSFGSGSRKSDTGSVRSMGSAWTGMGKVLY